MAKHHPTLEQLIDYCSGAMPLSHGICVATHLEYCETCRQHVDRLNQMGGVFLDSMAPQGHVQNEGEAYDFDSSDKALKQQVFDLLDEAAESEHTPMAEPCNSGVPKSLRQFINADYGGLSWKNITFSIKLASLLRDKDGAQIALSRTNPGGKMFHHSHTGDEITVVLKGSFSDEDGIYKEGDFVFRDAKDKHTPIVTRDSECICLMVLGSPIQFTGFFTRMLNPLIRMNH